MNLIQIKQQVQKIVARNNQEVINNLNYFINQRIKRICDFFDFSFLRQIIEYNIEPGRKSYVIPQNFKNDGLFFLKKENYYQPLYITSDHNIILKFKPEYRGEPRYVLLGSRLFSLFPIPDKEYTLQLLYYGYLNELEQDNDKNYLTETQPQLIIDGVCADVFAFLFEYEQARYYEEKFNQGLILLKRQDVVRRLPDVMYLGVVTDVKRSPLE